MADPLLSVFPPALLRLILCGGGGLPAAYGPLRFVDPHYLDRKEQDAIWSGSERLAYFSDTDDCAAWGMDSFESAKLEWRLPLDHWRSRLAVVAAHLVLQMPLRDRPPISTSAEVIVQGDHVSLLGLGPASLMWSGSFATLNVLSHTWTRSGQAAEPCLYLPTLPAHLLTHDPAVALLLALFDVPEIRAKVEALNG